MKRKRIIALESKIKLQIRDTIARIAKESKSFLELYGEGDMYRYCKALGVNILSIDNGKSFKHMPEYETHLKRLKRELRGKDKKFISLQDLAKTSRRKHDVIWLDYCGPLSNDVWNDITALPRIMEDTGTIFITYQEGRENGLPGGTMRKVINETYARITKLAFKKAGLKVEKIIKRQYLSDAKWEGKTRKTPKKMITIGFEWTKIK